MRIGIEGQRLFRKNKHGMDIVAMEVIKKLQQLDIENEYYIFVQPGEDHDCLQETANFKIIEIKASNYFIWEQILLVRYVKKYKIDILHCTSNTAPLLCPVPLLLTLHDVIFLEKPLTVKNTATLYQRAGNLYRKWLVPRLANQCVKIITVSFAEKEQIKQKLALHNHNIEVIYNGVSDRFHQNTSLELLEQTKMEYQIPEHYFFFLGNSDPKKNMIKVLEAFAAFADKNKDVYLVMADVSKTLVAALLQSINKIKVLERIILPGYIHPTKLPVFYKGAMAFLYPSLRESFGLPILEAMACGTPVITSNVAAMPEIAGDAALLVNPYDSFSILSAMESIVSCNVPDLTSRGLEQAAKFSWSNTASQVLSLYKSLYVQPASPVL